VPIGPEIKFYASFKSSSATMEDIVGTLILLQTAKVSALKYCTNERCIQMLDDCITALRGIHVIEVPGIEAGARAPVDNAPALLNLLDYLQTEIGEGLQDKALGAKIGECTALVMANQGVSGGQIYPEAPPTKH